MFPDSPERTQNRPRLGTDSKLSYGASAPGKISRPNFCPTLPDCPFPPSAQPVLGTDGTINQSFSLVQPGTQIEVKPSKEIKRNILIGEKGIEIPAFVRVPEGIETESSVHIDSDARQDLPALSILSMYRCGEAGQVQNLGVHRFNDAREHPDRSIRIDSHVREDLQDLQASDLSAQRDLRNLQAPSMHSCSDAHQDHDLSMPIVSHVVGRHAGDSEIRS